MSLKGKALSWASQILIGKMDQMDLQTLTTLLRRRFRSESNKQVALTKFINLEISQTRSEFSDMLRFANSIYKKEIVRIEVLAQMVVDKTPGEIRACLYQAGLAI
ncbi:hypothetical protein NGRA_2342, partial [Nosema granulosis]